MGIILKKKHFDNVKKEKGIMEDKKNSTSQKYPVSKKETGSLHGSINSSDIKMTAKDYERKLATEKKLAGYKEQMSQLVDRIATNSFQG